MYPQFSFVRKSILAACLFAGAVSGTRAQTVINLTVNIFDSSAVVITGTGDNAIANYTASSAVAFSIRLVGLFSADVDIVENPTAVATGSTLASYGSDPIDNVLTRTNPGKQNLVIRHSLSSANSFSTSNSAFTGTGTFDLTSFSPTFVAAGYVGNIIAGDGSTVVGHFSVVSTDPSASSVPEPSTYAALAGFFGLAIAVVGKRRNRSASVVSS
jgi:hypothetical protein